LTDMIFVSVGVGYTPTGDASFAAKDVAGGKNFDMTISDLMEYYIEPSVTITSDAAVFLHIGITEGDLAVKGTDVLNQTKSLDGLTASAGMKVVTENNIFIKVEAGMTEYDTINITSINGTDGNATASAKGDTTIAFGALTVGYQF